MKKPFLSEKEPLRFDAEKHQYWIGKKRIPSVTEILRKVGLSKDFTGIDPFYADRGKATHLAIQFFLEGRLDENSLDPVIVPYFEGFKKYFAEHPMGITRCEVKGSYQDDFAGIMDCITETEIIDWKCSKDHDKVAELQGEAYKWIEAQEKGKFLPFKVVQFCGDGGYEIFEYGDTASHWASVMDLYQWKVSR